MEQYVLKEHVRDEIKGCKIQAALFYTFNFDPVLFENYIMPLLVPGKDFGDEMIYNKILWRRCLKEGIIPPVTVYCDFFAKNNTIAPSLGYSIHCLSLPSAPGSICNFHPKHIFLLLENDSEQSLLMFTGSGNLSTGGWCENFEAFSVQRFKKDNSFPRTVNTNQLQNMIAGIAGLKSTDGRLSDAEDKINDFLRYVDFNNDSYFNSTQQSFTDFLEQKVFSREKIDEMEIISPYFSDDVDLLQYLKNKKKIPEVKCLIPTSRHNEIQIKEDLFVRLRENGLIWCKWQEYISDNRVNSRNDELRNLHAKIYILHGKERTYTVVGSVNFTKTAWKEYSSRNKRGNIEAAWLYVEKRQKGLLTPKKIDVKDYLFIDMENRDQSSDQDFTRNIPEIDFVLNWETRTLEAKVRSHTKNCSFHNILTGVPIVKGTTQHDLLPDDFRQLTKNTLVEIKQSSPNGESVISYYVQQEKIGAKPLDFKPNISNILKYWSVLGDEYGNELLSRQLSQAVTDESGIIHEDKLNQRTLLNEMAVHFNALIKLERHLFSGSKSDFFRSVQYYLLSENIDTLPFYLRYLEEQSDKRNVLKSFYWMILQILQTEFYSRALRGINILKDEEKRTLRKNLRRKKVELNQTAEEIAKGIDMSDKEKHWILKQLAVNNE